MPIHNFSFLYNSIWLYAVHFVFLIWLSWSQCLVSWEFIKVYYFGIKLLCGQRSFIKWLLNYIVNWIFLWKNISFLPRWLVNFDSKTVINGCVLRNGFNARTYISFQSLTSKLKVFGTRLFHESQATNRVRVKFKLIIFY